MAEEQGRTAEPAPCRCMSFDAYISPMHPGHCCFWPATQDCHPVEFAAWYTKYRGVGRRV